MECFCPILGRPTQVRPVAYSSGQWKLVQCVETGFIFLANPPSYEAVATEFAWEKSFVDEKESRKQTEPLMSYFSEMFKAWRTRTFRNRDKLFALAAENIGNKQALAILDVGSGKGHRIRSFCQSFERQGIEAIPSGIEISSQLAEISDAMFRPLGGQVMNAAAYDGLGKFPPQEFDVMVMSCYLEHEARPLEVLQRARGILKEEGVIVIKVPNYNSLNRLWRRGRWCGFRFPDHVNYFTPATLRILATEAGFEMLPQQFSDRLPTSDNMYAVFVRRQLMDARQAA